MAGSHKNGGGGTFDADDDDLPFGSAGEFAANAPDLDAPGSDDPDAPIKDGMHPPTQPQLVGCLHCGEEYDSWRIEWRVNDRGHGFWCCPTPGCGGAGFGMDIWPADFDDDGTWTDADGRELHWDFGDDEEDEDDDFEFDDSGDGPDPPPYDMEKPIFDDDTLGEDDIPF